MSRKLIMGTAAALSLVFAATASADSSIPVQSLTGDWSPSNSTVTKVADGVHFGTYADGGANGGSLRYTGANGLPLSQVNDFSFTFNYKQAGNLSGATPYARIWLDTNHDGVWENGVDASIMFDPSNGGPVTPAQQVDQTFGTADDSVRYTDDTGNGAQQSWADVVAAHPTERIIMVAVSQGYSMGTDVSAMLKDITLNGEHFDFGVAPAGGLDGQKGDTGAAGGTGPAGKDGVTTIIHDHGTLSGNAMRTVHAPRIKGLKFISARASLRGKSVKTIHGRTIKVDLRGKTAGEYPVLITATYKAHGNLYQVRSIRSLSVTHN